MLGKQPDLKQQVNQTANQRVSISLANSVEHVYRSSLKTDRARDRTASEVRHRTRVELQPSRSSTVHFVASSGRWRAVKLKSAMSLFIYDR